MLFVLLIYVGVENAESAHSAGIGHARMGRDLRRDQECAFRHYAALLQRRAHVAGRRLLMALVSGSDGAVESCDFG